MVAKRDQPAGEPPEGVDTSPSSTDRPQVLHTYTIHTTDYVRLMMRSGMNLPMEEDRSALLVTEVWSFFSTSSILAHIV